MSPANKKSCCAVSRSAVESTFTILEKEVNSLPREQFYEEDMIRVEGGELLMGTETRMVFLLMEKDQSGM